MERLLWVCSGLIALAVASGCVQQPTEADHLRPDSLQAQLHRTLWVAYAPTNFDPNRRPPVIPSEQSLREDLKTLRGAGFDGLITYGADIPDITSVAEQEGFRHLLLGVWNPGDVGELMRTKQMASSELVLGVIVGNEGLLFQRYDTTILHRAMVEMRRDTGKPVSTTETIESYFTNSALVEWSDFLAVNAHPYFHAIRDPHAAAEWTARAYDNLSQRFPEEPLIFKEVGLPTRAEGLSEQTQAEYYEALRRTDVRYAVFEAFDALFKTGDVEQSWGVFRADRSAKPAAAVVGRVR